MKLSSVFHLIGRIVGGLGGIALIGAWLAGEGGTVLGLSQQHLFFDTLSLTLISIAAMVCGLFYLRLEETDKSYV